MFATLKYRKDNKGLHYGIGKNLYQRRVKLMLESKQKRDLAMDARRVEGTHNEGVFTWPEEGRAKKRSMGPVYLEIG
jgi:hypothetical protein